MEQQEQVLFSLPLRRMEPIFKNWVRDVLTENNPINELPTDKDPSEIITREELKTITGLSSDATVIKYEKLGIFKPMRLGRKVLYKKTQVLDAIKEFKRV